MTVNDVVLALGCEVLAGEDLLSKEVSGGYVSDLLSDVMGNAEDGQVWVTLQTHKNVIAIAALKEVAAVLIVKGLPVVPEVLKVAVDEDVIVLSTELETFEVTGKLYALLNA